MNFYCSPQTGHTTLNSTLYRQLENQAPNTAGSSHLYDTLEILMMGIKVHEICWANNKICNKNSSVASSWHFISTYYRRCTVKTTSSFAFQFATITQKIKTRRNINLPVVLYGCETWSLILREERRLRVFENRALGKKLRLKGKNITQDWRKLHTVDV
jgi:hypothetical protein